MDKTQLKKMSEMSAAIDDLEKHVKTLRNEEKTIQTIQVNCYETDGRRWLTSYLRKEFFSETEILLLYLAKGEKRLKEMQKEFDDIQIKM